MQNVQGQGRDFDFELSTSHLTQNMSFQRRSSQSISWLNLVLNTEETLAHLPSECSTLAQLEY